MHIPMITSWILASCKKQKKDKGKKSLVVIIEDKENDQLETNGSSNIV